LGEDILVSFHHCSSESGDSSGGINEERESSISVSIFLEGSNSTVGEHTCNEANVGVKVSKVIAIFVLSVNGVELCVDELFEE